MSRGNYNNRGGAFRGDQSRGRGGRSRGRGGSRGNGFRGGRGRGGYIPFDEFDLPISQWPDNDPPARGGFITPRGRGRGWPGNQGSGYNSPIPTRGTDSPRSRGRGRGRGFSGDTTPYGDQGRSGRSEAYLKSRLRAGVPLGKLLSEDRPLLKPVVFVRSVHTATLFQEEEDILQPMAEPVADDEKSHVPTADKVSHVFDGEDLHGESEDDRLEEIDFADLGKIQADVDAVAAVEVVTSTTSEPEDAHTEIKALEEKFTGFFVDTTPTPVTEQPANNVIAADLVEAALGEDDEEIIVYVAPHPRSGPVPPTRQPQENTSVQAVSMTSILTGVGISAPQEADDAQAEGAQAEGAQAEVTTTPTQLQAPAPIVNPETPAFESVSFAFGSTTRKKQTRKLFPVGGPRSLLKRSKKARQRPLRHFGSYGAMLSEAHLQEEVHGKEKDSRESEQRRGDSDVNWGDSDEDEGDAIDEISNGVGAMEIDTQISLEDMRRFVHSMSAEGSRHVTMDDVADTERMREEDEEEAAGRVSDSGSSSDENESERDRQEVEEEIENIFDEGERALVGEVHDQNGGAKGEQPEEEDEEDEEEEEDDDDDDDDILSSDDEASPKSSFQARLAAIRARDRGKGRADSSDDELEMTRADDDDDFFAELEDILHENRDILNGGGRKAGKKLFQAISDGDFDGDDFAVMMQPTRGKDKCAPSTIQDQWERDREKKAENKRKRAQARLEAAADPLAQHKSGKKSRKAMLAAFRLDVSVDMPNRITNLVSLEQQIRRFLDDIEKVSMALPPADKGTRKKIHALATAFNLKSQSKGSGKTRYTTLFKTTKSGIGINEKKIRNIMKGFDRNWEGPNEGKGNGKPISLVKHREGEVVGKAAPKIGESNVGFKMLAAMGWSEGDRIGLSGGLEAPLNAVMKKTKLGLGATITS
ncbi:uncharacterized protein LAESUDRAFT_703719 [Laetiporus sulphureus 93-53]|uniref:Protein SQS1 n=1 Tax=Laetiporus sulphureus 93-53 TaxID=1314785 RepID=A0A165D4D2_9APHY|nr:uncharacterized protein LAESUDRAFT_703719 [Laetiporus sulphureus 93-53]KZT04134.1 hypothetical protein LAESUDRAFT_703719 [Laetiporus sulphureus 93-53]